MKTVCSSISAQNTFTEEIIINGPAVLSVDDTSSMSMTVTLQRKHAATGTWKDCSTVVTAEGLYTIVNCLGSYRVGCKTGDYTSGTASICLTGDD